MTAASIARRAELGPAETAYLLEMDQVLRDLPRTVRSELLEEAAGLLGERPVAADRSGLVDEVGEPRDLADSLRNSAGFESRVGRRRRWLMQSTRARVVQVAVVLAVLWAGMAGVSWLVATPVIFNPCGGVVAAQSEDLRAGGVTEHRVTFQQDGRFGIYVCPTTEDDGVVIDSVRFVVPSRLAFQPVGAELDTARLDGTMQGDASNFTSYRPTDYPWLAWVVLWFEMEYCTSGGAVLFDTVEVDYRYRGRDRTTTLDLGYTVAVALDEQCTESVRAQVDVESDAFWSATQDSFAEYGYPVDDLTPLLLWPENVSRDLCRYLDGPIAPGSRWATYEPLDARAVFRVEDLDLAETLIDGAVLGICPEFADRRDELVDMLADG